MRNISCRLHSYPVNVQKMVILSQTTLENSNNKSAYYLKHLLRDLFHTVWGQVLGNNCSAWGLGSWEEATLHYLVLDLCFSNSNGPF